MTTIVHENVYTNYGNVIVFVNAQRVTVPLINPYFINI